MYNNSRESCTKDKSCELNMRSRVVYCFVSLYLFLPHLTAKTLFRHLSGVQKKVMDLNPLNVVMESTFTPSEDHHARVAAWRDGLLAAIYGAVAGWRSAQPSTETASAPPEYVFIGSSTQVGLALLVFGTAKTAAQLTHMQTANVKTGFGGLLGNKVGMCTLFPWFALALNVLPCRQI
jgi:hypothetical protein